MTEPKKKYVKHVPTDEQRRTVRVLTACGVTVKQIASIIGVSQTALSNQYKREMADGFDSSYGLVLSRLWNNILAGDRASIFFWLKTRAGWRETQKLDFDGPDGSPQSIIVKIEGIDKGL